MKVVINGVEYPKYWKFKLKGQLKYNIWRLENVAYDKQTVTYMGSTHVLYSVLPKFSPLEFTRDNFLETSTPIIYE